MRKFLSTLLCSVLVCVSVLSGCGSQETHSDNVVSNEENVIMVGEEAVDPSMYITISGWLAEPYTKNLMAYLAEKYPEYTFKYNYTAKVSYESITDAQLASKTGADIVMLNPAMANRHAQNGYIEDLTEYCRVFNETAWNAFSYEDKMYAVPNTCEYQCTFYNKDIYEELSLDMPNSFNEYLNLCDYLRKEKNIKPCSAALKNPERIADSALAFLSAGYFNTARGKSFGKRLVNGETSFREELEPYLVEWRDLVNHKIYTKEMCLTDAESAIEEFAKGNSFTYTGNVEDYNRIIEINPDIRLGTMGFLGAVRGKSILIGGCTCGFGVNSYSKKKVIAVEIVAGLATQEGQKALWSDRMGSQTYMNGVSFTNPEAFDGIRPILSTGRIYLPWIEWGDYCSQIYEQFGVELQKVVIGERTIDVALKVLDDKIAQLQ